MGFRMVKIFLTSDDPWRPDSNISRDVLFCLQNSVLLHLDWRSRREVLLPLTESKFHGHETTQLLNNCWSYDDEI